MDRMQHNDKLDARLDAMFAEYRMACPDPEPSANFMPQMWAKIEMREASTNWFGSMAKALVTAFAAIGRIWLHSST